VERKGREGRKEILCLGELSGRHNLKSEFCNLKLHDRDGD